MTVEHIEAAFEHTIFIRPDGEGFTSAKSKYIALDHIVITSSNTFKVGQLCDVEITLLDSVSAKPIKLRAKVEDIKNNEVRLNYLEVSELAVQKLDQIILHNTRQPIEFEVEIDEFEKSHHNLKKAGNE